MLFDSSVPYKDITFSFNSKLRLDFSQLFLKKTFNQAL